MDLGPGQAIGAGVGVAGGILQYVNAEKARKASAAERDDIQALISKLQSPNFNVKDITPQDYKLAQQYMPQVASFAEEKNPQLIQDTAAGQQGLDAQMSALQKFKNLGESGEDVQSRIMQSRALEAAQKQNQGQQGAIQQSFAQRGQGGSGNEFLASLMAQQGANQNATNSSQNAAMEAYQNKLNAIKTSAGLGGDIRSTELGKQAQNAGILNAFNQRAAAQRNAYNQYASGTANDAQKYNIGNLQDIMNKNVSQGNQAAINNRDYANQMAQTGYGNEVGKTQMLAGNQNAKIGDISGSAAAQNQAIAGATGIIAGAASGMGSKKKNPNDEETAGEDAGGYGNYA